jgi:anaerobic magnesium-protoporphyrin IX monomethyl ester cyclase
MKLNYLIIMPKFVDDSSDGYIFPLGLAYISSSLKKAGFTLYNLNLNNSSKDIEKQVQTCILENKIDVVMTGALSAQFNSVKIIVDSVNKINKDIIMIIGGGLITAEPTVAMDALEFADYGVIGEGESTIVELCGYLESKEGKNLEEIDGIIYKNHILNNYIITKKRKEMKDLDSIPWPDYEGFEYEKNIDADAGVFSSSNKRVGYILSSRSCPFKCTFCFHTAGNIYRQRSFDEVFKELDYLITKYKIDEFYFADELFTVNIERVREFCDRIKNYKITWVTAFRVSDVTEELVRLIKSTNNCSYMGFGLESADNNILKSMRKKITIEQTDNALEICRRLGVPTQGGFIFGDINETVESSEMSIKWLKENQDKYNVKVAHIIAYPGTYIYNYACERNIIKDKIQFLKDGCPQVNISKMTDEEYFELNIKINELNSNPTGSSNSFEVCDADKNGFISVKGKCYVCDHENNWGKVRLFKFSFMTCAKCKQKFIPPVNNKIIIDNLKINIQKLLISYGKIGIWGMGEHVITILKNSDILENKMIFPIDISLSKQGNSLFERKVFSPDIINNEDIECVIVAVAMHIGSIGSQIKVQFPNVKKIVDISNMIAIA